MARKLLVLLNVGTDDQKKYGVPNGPNSDMPPMEGDVIEVADDLADILVNRLKVARDFDAKEVRSHQERVEAEDKRRMDQFQALRGDVARESAARGDFTRMESPKTEGGRQTEKKS
jgi:hypothetical protein